jgi:hypothetical protein
MMANEFQKFIKHLLPEIPLEPKRAVDSYIVKRLHGSSTLKAATAGCLFERPLAWPRPAIDPQHSTLENSLS